MNEPNLKDCNAFFSVYDKTYEQLVLATTLERLGCKLIASGGTKEKFLEPAGRQVIDCADITGLKPVLDHRVVTLTPQLHGGLLAEQQHLAELNRLGWPQIQFLICTFYPLSEMMKFGKTFDEINANGVDIGGPAMVRSAVKGGKWVIVDNGDVDWFGSKLLADTLTENDREWLRLKATTVISQYVSEETVFRTNRLRPE